jgi:hypothetical protein
MSPYIININGQKIRIDEVEFLYKYEDKEKQKYIVFEYQGNKYQSKIENERTE